MDKFEMYENKLYVAKLRNKKIFDSNIIKGNTTNIIKIWNEIRNNRELLEWAIKIKKDKSGKKDKVNGVAICESILYRYYDVDKDIYEKLINIIFSNIDIARSELTNAANGGYSFLLLALDNENLKLTEEQKTFAVSEAMKILGAKGEKKDIGSHVHGIGAYDIRYEILKNPNWSVEEKQKLIYDFWENDEDYSECLETWQDDISNNEANFSDDSEQVCDLSNMYELTYEDLLKAYGNKISADTIWKEISICKLARELREPVWLKESCSSRVLSNS